MKRFVSLVLSLIMLFPVDLCAKAVESAGSDNYQLSENLFQYLNGNNAKRLILRQNYAYMVFVEDFNESMFAGAVSEVTDMYTHVGTEPDEAKYIEVLINLFVLYEQENAAAMVEQKQLDNLKTGRDYLVDGAITAAGVATSWVNANPNISKLEDGISKALGGLSAVAADIDNWIDALSRLEVVVQDYADYEKFLSVLEANAEGELKSAVVAVQEQLQQMMELRLEAYGDVTRENIETYTEYFVSDWFIDICKKTPEYQDDAVFKGNVDFMDNILQLSGAWNAGAALGMFSANLVIGGENLINRLHEMMALHEISVILQSEVLNCGTEFLEVYPSKNSDELAKDYIILSNYLVAARLRGEYCIFSVVSSDEGILRWFKKNQEETSEWYERQNDRILNVRNTLNDISNIEKPESEIKKDEEEKDKPVSSKESYERFLKAKGYRAVTDEWEEEYSPTDYAYVDIDQNGIDELIIIGNNSDGFGLFAVYSYTPEKNVYLIQGMEYYSWNDSWNKTDSFYCFGVPGYISRTASLVFDTVRPGAYGGGCQFNNLENGVLRYSYQIMWNASWDDGEYDWIIDYANSTTPQSISEKDALSYWDSEESLDYYALP